MDPPAGITRAGSEYVNKSCDIMVCRLLTFEDCLDREGRGADCIKVGFSWALSEGFGAGHFDLAPSLHAGLVGPQVAKLRSRVAINHATTDPDPSPLPERSEDSGELNIPIPERSEDSGAFIITR